MAASLRCSPDLAAQFRFAHADGQYLAALSSSDVLRLGPAEESLPIALSVAVVVNDRYNTRGPGSPPLAS